MIEVTPVFATMREAKEWAKSNGLKREVFVMEHTGFEPVYVAAQNVLRANDHFMRTLRGRIGVKIRHVKDDLEDTISKMSIEELKELKQLLEAKGL